MKFEKRSQFFVGGDDESLSVVAVCISNEDRLSVGINRCDAAPTPTGFAEIVSDDFPELHVDRIVPLLVSTQQSQNDMKGGANDAGFRAELNKRAMRAWRGLCRIIRHLQWRRASDTKLKADAPHCNSGYPSRGPAVNHRIIKAGWKLGLRFSD